MKFLIFKKLLAIFNYYRYCMDTIFNHFDIPSIFYLCLLYQLSLAILYILYKKLQQFWPDIETSSYDYRSHEWAYSFCYLCVDIGNKYVFHLFFNKLNSYHLQSRKILFRHCFQSQPSNLPYADMTIFKPN